MIDSSNIQPMIICDIIHPPNIMKHFPACNIQFPECRRLTPFSCVMTILTSRKGLWGYDRDDMSCQHYCTVCLLRTFPSHYSICKQHVIPTVQHLHVLFSCFLISVMISLIGKTVVRVLLYYVDCEPLQFPFIIHYLYMSCGASTKTIYGFWRLWSMGFKLMKTHNFISLSNAPIFIYKRCRTLESL